MFLPHSERVRRARRAHLRSVWSSRSVLGGEPWAPRRSFRNMMNLIAVEVEPGVEVDVQACVEVDAVHVHWQMQARRQLPLVLYSMTVAQILFAMHARNRGRRPLKARAAYLPVRRQQPQPWSRAERRRTRPGLRLLPSPLDPSTLHTSKSSGRGRRRGSEGIRR